MGKQIAVSGTTNAYRVLLGDAVIDDLRKTLSKPSLKEFIRLHAQYDALAEKHPKSDPVTMLETDALPRFDGLDTYLKFLYRTSQKLKPMREEPAPELNKLVEKMIKLAEAKEPKETTAAWVNDRFHGKTLPGVPLSMKNVDALPYSYPSFERTYDVVRSFWNDKSYHSRLENELSRTVKLSLARLSEHLKHTAATVEIEDLAVAAQSFLMDRNWIRYGLENVAKASYALAQAGVEHEVTTDGDILFSKDCGIAYSTLGANLEAVLRKAVFNLSKEVLNGVVLAGRQPAIDVVIACCSMMVQEFARDWIVRLHERFQVANVDQAGLSGYEGGKYTNNGISALTPTGAN